MNAPVHPSASPREIATRAVRELYGPLDQMADPRNAPIEVGGVASGSAVFGFGDRDANGVVSVKVYAKVYPDRGASAQHARLLRLRHVLQTQDTGHPLHIPQPLGVDQDGRCLLQAPARGQLLSDLPAGPKLLAALSQTGAALARLHRTPASVLGHAERSGERLHDQIDALMRPQPDTLARQCAPLTALVRQVQTDIARRHEDGHRSAPATLAHRDVHPRQLFVSPQGIDLIDWDLAGAADPALDLANLLIHLDRRWPGHQADCTAALCEGYGAERMAALRERLPVWRAFHHLRRACKSHRLGAEPARIHAELLAAQQALATPSRVTNPGVPT
ncbi:phosphotransferase family protein [Sphaerotilus mobilis]|uniref:Phosphotransferase family enzyme n=1 Tax=Sphaerotilus mobilis TaxID=47994 RepID=A0A4Q7LSD9_9BURK|nr:aminoglycoside phosphotransferase family protein [Sphaerotilus mobilis]RZS56828.1 phosphotransferase family enzyme [Sphaerotilus mobilis]